LNKDNIFQVIVKLVLVGIFSICVIVAFIPVLIGILALTAYEMA